ncbi:MAG: sulfotransferase family protein [Phycisphaerales bacterium]
MRLPSFVIIGAMKCATSTLAEQLGAQPGVFMCQPKEPNFFSDDEQYRRGMAWYASLFEPAPAGAVLGEASTHYTKLPTHPHACERLVAALPNARLVYVMRDPIDRLVSQYVHEWTQRLVSGPIDEAIRANMWMVDYGRYAMQLGPWLAAFGPERILPVFSERLRQQPQAELDRVWSFLGLPGTARWQDLGDSNVSADRLRRSPWRDALVDAPVLRQIRRGLIPRSVRDRVKRVWQMRRRPELGDAIRRELVEIYDADLAQLGDWLGLSHGELSCASYRETVGRIEPRFCGYRSAGASA